MGRSVCFKECEDSYEKQVLGITSVRAAAAATVRDANETREVGRAL